VPGHGKLATKADMIAWREMLITSRDRIQKLINEGKTEQKCSPPSRWPTSTRSGPQTTSRPKTGPAWSIIRSSGLNNEVSDRGNAPPAIVGGASRLGSHRHGPPKWKTFFKRRRYCMDDDRQTL
jgi:hypothetical protein